MSAGLSGHADCYYIGKKMKKQSRPGAQGNAAKWQSGLSLRTLLEDTLKTEDVKKKKKERDLSRSFRSDAYKSRCFGELSRQQQINIV